MAFGVNEWLSAIHYNDCLTDQQPDKGKTHPPLSCQTKKTRRKHEEPEFYLQSAALSTIINMDSCVVTTIAEGA